MATRARPALCNRASGRPSRWLDRRYTAFGGFSMRSETSRRRFLQAAAVAPVILHADDKAGTKAPVLGSGEHTYEAIHDWGELPAYIKYGNTHGAAEDSQANIYVHHTVNAASESSDSMVVFDHQGKFVKSWGKEFKGGAHGLHFGKR